MKPQLGVYVNAKLLDQLKELYENSFSNLSFSMFIEKLLEIALEEVLEDLNNSKENPQVP